MEALVLLCRWSDDIVVLELWGGAECTINRVGNIFYDQFRVSGHDARPGDLDRVAELGIRTLRYPVLWERVVPHGDLAHADWSWHDARLAQLRELGIRPIVGLVHHGSGPTHTSLIDPLFPKKLAGFARAVAGRYPWVTDWTPVNEPLTTARFSGLYGHWFPHGRDEKTFARALIIQCRAVAEAMRAIREVTPGARLVQTEDVGKTWSTPALRHQADFENERRWVTFDLLCGRVTSYDTHRMWGHLRWAGVCEEDLRWFVENPCPPDVLGVNHYVTSERFLDERTERYPIHTHGDNGQQHYADVEAARVLADGAAGPGALLRETWERFRLPVAITEAHLGCTREEQMRWLWQVWNEALALRTQTDADVRAVTVWSLLGAYDWNSLLTRFEGHYEPGVFDLRGRPGPRPTALAGLTRALASGQTPYHPALATPGWWRRPDRLLYPPVTLDACLPPSGAPIKRAEASAPLGTLLAPPVLITGGNKRLVQALARASVQRGLAHVVVGDLSDLAGLEDTLEHIEPWAVVAAGPSEGGTCGDKAFPFFRGTGKLAMLAEACARRGVRLVLFSQAEEGVNDALPSMPGALIVRTGALFGPDDDHDALTQALKALAEKRAVRLPGHALDTPCHREDVVRAAFDLLIDGESGQWHLAHPERAGDETIVALSPADLVRRAARLAGLDDKYVDVGEAPAAGAPGRTTNPFSAGRLGDEKTRPLLPPLDDALARHVQDSRPLWARVTASRPRRDGVLATAR